MRSKFYTTSDLARLLNITRVAVFKKIKKGEIEAEKVGGNYLIPAGITDGLTLEQEKLINRVVAGTVSEYGETLKLLGKE